MTIEEAIKILDPETTREALSAYCYDPEERIRVVEEACEIACAALRAQQWVSVKDRLPEDGEVVLTLVSGKPRENIELIDAYELATYYERYGWHVDEFSDWYAPQVSHWMPLPKPPKEEQK